MHIVLFLERCYNRSISKKEGAIFEFNAKDMNYEQQSEMLKRMIEKIVINQNDIKIYLNI